MPGGLMMPPAGGLIFPPSGLMPMEMRQPPLGRMSPGPRDRSTRSYDSRSPSPDYHRSPRSARYRDHSPASRSERRPSPPSVRHRGPSPARSERFYRDRRQERDRYYSSSRDRSVSPDRGPVRTDRTDRDRDRAGPKTSTPG